MPVHCDDYLAFVPVAANPAWQDVPGFINTTHIYTDGPEMGWTFYSSNASTVTTASTIFMESSTISIKAEHNTVILEQVQGKGVNNTTALCVTTNHTQVSTCFQLHQCRLLIAPELLASRTAYRRHRVHLLWHACLFV